MNGILNFQTVNNMNLTHYLKTGHEQGIILPVVLIFLLILALLTNTILSITQMQSAVNNHLTEKILTFYAAENCLTETEKTLAGDHSFSCILDAQIDKPWQSKNFCNYASNPINIHYVIEELINQNANCILVNSPEDITGGKAIFYRITAWPATNKINLILQTTFAKNSALTCDKKLKHIKPGRMSWRCF